MSKEHRLSGSTALNISDLKGEVLYSIAEGPLNPMFHEINDTLASSGAEMFFPTLNGFYEGVTMAAAGDCIAVMPNTGVIPTEFCTYAVLDYPLKYHLGLYVSQGTPSDIQEFCELATALCQKDHSPPIIE